MDEILASPFDRNREYPNLRAVELQQRADNLARMRSQLAEVREKLEPQMRLTFDNPE